jgi:hypothetical protein
MADIWTVLLAVVICAIVSNLLKGFIYTKQPNDHRRYERISRLKNRIDNGTYVVDGKKIAAKMLGKPPNKRSK